MNAIKATVVDRFKSNERGNVAMMFGATAVVMGMVVGIAIDMASASQARQHMQSAADAAALAAAYPDLTNRSEVATRLFNAQYKGLAGQVPQLSIQVDEASHTVTFSAKSEVPTTLMRLFGVDHLAVDVSSKVEASFDASGNKLEVAMMVDLTGSMGASRNGMAKIDALKAASNDLLDILFPSGSASSETTRVAIAPMADYVNAGQYAAAVTGLDPRGPYNNLTNLKTTRQSPFTGRYSGITGSSTGSQFGATPANSASGGDTYTNYHCSNPNSPPILIAQANYDATSIPVGPAVAGVGAAPAQLLDAGAVGHYDVNALDNTSAALDWEMFTGVAADELMGQLGGAAQLQQGAGNLYIPIPESVAGITYMTNSVSGKLLGVPAYVADGAQALPLQFKSAVTEGGYLAITGYANGDFTLAATATTTGYFIPVPVTMLTTVTLPDCTSAPNPDNGYLISCVTERSGPTHRNDDEFPDAGDFLGPFNKSISGKNIKLNYSEDGACMTAGRELPSVIPLTNQRALLQNFFDNATIGGSTPGHLGHAWAWYMLSPKWNSLWPSASSAGDYNDPSVIKAAIIMTDGEYNTEFTDEDSKVQALALCDGMRKAGITVYTIGFGLDGTGADNVAAQTLRKCANSEKGKYFLAYDHDALSQAFQSIASELKSKQLALKILN